MSENETRYVVKRYEEKLKELMGKEEFSKFSNDVAKEMFRSEIEGMAPSDFRDFCLENFGKIVGEKECG